MSFGLKQGVATFFLALLMVGCVGVGSKTASPQLEAKEVVAGLAVSRWKALIKGDIEGAYAYMSPAIRQSMSLDAYKAKIRPGKWKKASASSVSCEQDLCKVLMVIEYKYRDMTTDTGINERWLLENGKWWFVGN